MNIFFALVCVSIAVSSNIRAVEKIEESVVEEFKATVQDIIILQEFRGRAKKMGADPRWVLKVQVLGEENARFYAIHSPVQLLGKEKKEAVGNLFHFTIKEVSVFGTQVKSLSVIKGPVELEKP